MKKNLLVLTFLLVTVFAFGQKLPFQGKLILDGEPVATPQTFVFEISSLGWSETHTNVPVTDGLYFVVLGSINPLPDSLFYGVDQQNMNITVSGTVLSPVVLFKPLSSPFEGSELVVKNDEGTIVGSMHALKDSVNKNGELIVNGTNGNPNFSVTGWGEGGNRGSIAIHDAEGDIKANMFTYNNIGRLNLLGENVGKINMGFSKPWDPNGGETIRDLPTISMEVDGLYYSNLYAIQWDTVTAGRFYLASNNGEFLNLRTDRIQLRKNDKNIFNLGFQNWSGLGNAGYFQLDGPNSRNIEINSRHWEDPDIPMILLTGRDSVTVVEISAETDSTEMGKIILNSKTDKSMYMNAGHVNFMSDQGNTYLNTNGLSIFHSAENKSVDIGPTQLALKDNANGHRHLVDLSTRNGSGNGWAGYFSLRGPNFDNINMGTRDWEGTPDLPFINLHGENDFHGMELSITRDGNGDQFGWINLSSENGRSLHLSPEGIGVEGVGMDTHSKDSLKYGYLYTRGPSTTNFETGGDWENPDRAYLNMNGNTDEHRLRFAIYEDGNQNEHGNIEIRSAANKQAVIEHDQITFWNTGDPNGWKDYVALRYEDDGQGNEQGTLHLNSKEEKTAYLSPRNIALRDDANGYHHLVDLSSHNNSGNGWAGYFSLNGSNSSNISMGTRDWEGTPDLPLINLHGENDFHAMELSVSSDGNGTQEGFLNLKASSGRTVDLNPNILALHNMAGNQTAVLQTADHGQGEVGYLRLNGPNSTVFEFMPSWWDQPDRARLQLNGVTNDGRMNIGVTDDGQGNEHGEIYIHSSAGPESYLSSNTLHLRKADGSHLVGLHIEDDGNGMLQGNVSVDSDDGRSLNLHPDGFNTNKTSIGNVNSGFGTNSELFLNGANSPNIQMGGQHWENSDLGFFTVFTDKSDGNGWYYGGASISAGTDGPNSWGSMDLFNNGVNTINLNGNTGDINISGTLTQSSDRRLKKDVVKLSSSLDKLSRLQGVSYYWKSDTLNTKLQIGLIAQEVEKIYPELVVTKDDGFKALNYSQMVAVLIEATKELNAKVERLETENIQLKAELSASASNTSEISELKEQMQTLFKMVELHQTEATSKDHISTLGLK